MEKIAEKFLADADKFPVESIRETLARTYGIDAVALSGPCEGQNLVSCVVNQLEKRWDKIKDRFAGNMNKVHKLATKIGESYMQKDDTKECTQDLEKIGYKKQAASGIASYIKAYAMDIAADEDIGQAMDSVATEPSFEDEVPPAPDFETEVEGPVEEMSPELPPPAPELPSEGVAPASDIGEVGGETVTIELPKELAEELHEALMPQLEQAPVDGIEPEMGGEVSEVFETEPDIEIEVIGDEAPVDAVVEEVPGEPVEGIEEHEVHGEPEEACMAGGALCSECAGKGAAPKCSRCGAELKEKEAPVEEKHEEAEGHVDSAEEAKVEKKVDPSEPAHDAPKEEKEEHEKKELPEVKEKEEKAVEHKEKSMEEAKVAMNFRAGHLTKHADTVLKIGPEMSINNTGPNQIGPHEGHELGNAKDKAVEAPKPLENGNVKPEGFTAGDSKFQDGSTMGHEPKFDAKDFDKASATGGSKSIMGKDESFPEGGPKVPAGSAPIGGEVWTGGDLATKGTVIASIKPDGIHVEANGKKYVAKGKITDEMVDTIKAGLEKITYEGDAKKYAEAAWKVIKSAEKSGNVDNVTKTDTSKLEGSKFTNDGEKKPDEGGAKTGKGKPAKKDEGETKTDTSKLEGEKFTNDADKKPEGEKKASTEKEVKTAKPVEAPKALEDGNVKPEGFTANDSKFHGEGGSTQGSEKKFEAKEVKKEEVSKGQASALGKDEEFPTGKADVPVGGKLPHDEWEGGNVSTKGTTIANQSEKRVVEDSKVKAEASIREARLKSASVYVSDLLAAGLITSDEYPKELEKIAALPVPAIQSLIANSKALRARVASVEHKSETKVAGLGVPVVVNSSKNELSLKERLVAEFKLTKDLDRYDSMK